MQHSHKIQELIKPTLPLPPSLCYSIFFALSSPPAALAALSRATAPPCGLLGGWLPRHAGFRLSRLLPKSVLATAFLLDPISSLPGRPDCRCGQVGGSQDSPGKKKLRSQRKPACTGAHVHNQHQRLAIALGCCLSSVP